MKLEWSGSEMYFFDTYALYQIAKGEASYLQFQKHSTFHTTLMNAYELYYVLIKEGQEQLAELFFEKLVPICLEFTPEDVRSAAQFRLRNSRKKFSYVDALGYIISLKKGLLFLTGDDAFREFENVKFLK